MRTEAGHVEARRAVLATSAYTHHLVPGVTHRFIPLYDYILVSDPLTAAQRDAIGWRHRQGVSDGRTFFNYYRLTADDRILWGTSEAAYYPGNRVDPSCDHSPGHYAGLRESFRRHFPALAALEFPYAWGGAICSTTRLTPFFGRALEGRVDLRAGLHRTRGGHDAAGRADPRPPRARPARASCSIWRWSAGSRFPIRPSRCGPGRSGS